MKTIFAVLALFLVAMVFAAAVAKRKGSPGAGGSGAYRARSIMTANELEFFGRLVTALPGHYVFPQVAMSALIEAANSDKKMAHSDRLRVAQQRADYVVCTAGGEVVAVIELDDRTHVQAKDQLRDLRLEQAGIRTVRFQSRNKPTPAAIHVAIFGASSVAAAPLVESATALEVPRPS